MQYLHVTDLAYAHPGGDTLFFDVGFRLPAGAHAGLVGVNGVGKSTLLRIAAGVERPTRGRAELPGRGADVHER